MKNNKHRNLNLRSLLYNKKFTVTLSVILSFSIWLVVMINRNPVRDQIFTDMTVSVSIDNTVASEMGLGIVSDYMSQKFSVTVSGPNYIVSSIKPEDILLSASVTDVNAAGTYSLEVLGTRNSTKTGYTFSSISPSTIDVTFDYIDTKEFTVVPKLIGVSAADGLIAEAPAVSQAEQNTVTIKGPRSVIEKISTVGSYAEVNKKLSSTQSYDSDIVLYDEAGEIIYRYSTDGKIYGADGKEVENNNLNLSFTTVKVSQPISKKATVKVAVSFTNLPSGIKSDSIKWKVDHSEVSVIGTPDVISSLEAITLPAVNFNNVSTSSNSFEVTPTLPDGVKLLDNIEYFVVSIDTSAYAEKTFNVYNIRTHGLGSGLNAKTASSVKNVKICGPADVINNLRAADLYADLDLTDKSAGEHTVSAVIKSDKSNMIWHVGEYNTTVTIG